MKPEQFIDELNKEGKFDYGLCPPPVKADKGLDVLIEHFLGKDWYVTMPISKEQIYTEAIYTILKKHQKTSIIKRLKNYIWKTLITKDV
jgi:hypothetical protein